MTDLSAPIFAFRENHALTVHDEHTRAILDGLLAMTGPSVKTEPGHLPVRGDLAHIKLAGRYFVPHYAVPMPHVVAHVVWLRNAARFSADEVCELPVGASFDVLDMAGDWAWGQYGDDGPVGYVPLSNLESA